MPLKHKQVFSPNAISHHKVSVIGVTGEIYSENCTKYEYYAEECKGLKGKKENTSTPDLLSKQFHFYIIKL